MHTETSNSASTVVGEFRGTHYVHVETRAERLMRHSNFLADCAMWTLAAGVPDEHYDGFLNLCLVMDELAALSRLFEIIDGRASVSLSSSTNDQAP